MKELDQHITEMPDADLNRNIAQAAIHWQECPTGLAGAIRRQEFNDLLDHLFFEKKRRRVIHIG